MMHQQSSIEGMWYAERQIPARPNEWKRVTWGGVVCYATKEVMESMVAQSRAATNNSIQFRIKQYNNEEG